MITSSSIIVLIDNVHVLAVSLNAQPVAHDKMDACLVNDISVAQDEYLLISTESKIIVTDFMLKRIKNLETMPNNDIFSCYFSRGDVYTVSNLGVGVFR